MKKIIIPIIAILVMMPVVTFAYNVNNDETSLTAFKKVTTSEPNILSEKVETPQENTGRVYSSNEIALIIGCVIVTCLGLVCITSKTKEEKEIQEQKKKADKE